jgi:transcription initiation factor TFIID TATA-box-binding protein
VKIENIVCSGTLNQEINLMDLSRAGVIEYDPEMYHAGYIKTNGHSITLYRTGKYIMPGMKSFEDMKDTFDKVCSILSTVLDEGRFSAPAVRNMVCSSIAPYPLDLERMFIELLNRDYQVSYEPESFPGLILRTEGCTFNVFASGKFLILGCTEQSVAESSEAYFLELAEEILG